MQGLQAVQGRNFGQYVGAVLGQIATGGGASRLQQVMGSMGVVSLSKQTFTSIERFITKEVERQLSQSMLEAGKEEWKNAESSGDYFEGVPAIAVIADGGWSINIVIMPSLGWL